MKQILIIEDEQSIAELQADYLEIAGFETTIALTGKKGLEYALTEAYDLILLDLMLPEINGFELCEQLRARLDIPILMVTARKEDIDKIKGFDRGADDYIVKPFNPNELVARVRAHLARYQRLTKKDDTSHLLESKSLLVDAQARRVFLDERELIMTAKEYDLLLFLLTHPNQVFTKEQLFEQIWGWDAIGDNTTVTVHIRKIREKIEENPSKPVFIETVWGVGYRFRDN
ncbi:response regulator transcription factor [Gracilibacillus alcaliphilus]|uniref:response regulator transcription factor n=1 Tax=Gracilibacillus alcaliphilus TaxID=1401441 RepID=UPI00195C29FE|nr:response regulator transcription factor [Gracilibacillus alcaliphilus]MBM7676327.1 DNA-binding response OmpR family regulator [Gracilibacillus alcaliphilus]